MGKKKTISQSVRNYYLIINTVLFLIFGTVMLAVSAKTLIEKVEENCKVIVEQAGHSFEQTINDIVSQMVNFSSYHKLIALLNKTDLTAQEQLDLEREFGVLLKKRDLFNTIVQDIFVIADNGYVFSTAFRSNLAANYDYLNQEWYLRAKDSSDNSYVKVLGLHKQDFYGSSRAPLTESDTFSLAFAVKNARGREIGALIYNFNLEQMAEILESFNYEENGKVALLNEDAVILSCNDDQKIGSVLGLQEADYEILNSQRSGSFRAAVDDQQCFVSFQEISMGMKLVSFVPQSSIWSHTYFLIFVLISMIFAGLIINFMIAFFVTRSIRKPIQKLTENIQSIDSETLMLSVNEYQYQELDQIAQKFSELLSRLDLLIRQDYKSQILLNKFRLYSLQSQINPHFLMNNLQLLQTEIVYGNVENSNNIVVALSRILRYSLYNYDSFVPISMELQYIQSYLELFVQKYDGELCAEYVYDKELYKEYYMPKMLLQPIVENCIMHAFCEDPRDSKIRITVKEAPDAFVFLIEDNGCGIYPEQLEQIKRDMDVSRMDDRKIGIRNIHQRIQLLYGMEYGVRLESQLGKGTTFTIRIPQIKIEEVPGKGKVSSDETINCG